MSVPQLVPSTIPRVILSPAQGSDHFEVRKITLDTVIVIGRFNGPKHQYPSESNAIFSCKVLSKRHAEMWYATSEKKFFIKDTKSSNGTYVNYMLVGKGSEGQGIPKEIFSGDTVQFGVMVNSDDKSSKSYRCIIANVKLISPDGTEQKRPENMSAIAVPSLQDVCDLHRVIKEALRREAMSRSQLAAMSKTVASAKGAMQTSWNSMIDQDTLLAYVDILEYKQKVAEESISEDSSKQEIQKLIEEKREYQDISKNVLKSITEERSAILKEYSEIQREAINLQGEKELLQKACDQQFKITNEILVKFEASQNELQRVKNLYDTEKFSPECEEESEFKPEVRPGSLKKFNINENIEEFPEQNDTLTSETDIEGEIDAGGGGDCSANTLVQRYEEGAGNGWELKFKLSEGTAKTVFSIINQILQLAEDMYEATKIQDCSNYFIERIQRMGSEANKLQDYFNAQAVQPVQNCHDMGDINFEEDNVFLRLEVKHLKYELDVEERRYSNLLQGIEAGKVALADNEHLITTLIGERDELNANLKESKKMIEELFVELGESTSKRVNEIIPVSELPPAILSKTESRKLTALTEKLSETEEELASLKVLLDQSCEVTSELAYLIDLLRKEEVKKSRCNLYCFILPLIIVVIAILLSLFPAFNVYTTAWKNR